MLLASILATVLGGNASAQCDACFILVNHSGEKSRNSILAPARNIGVRAS
jgi:hypothetical protein